MGDITRAFHREFKICRRGIVPALKTGGALEGIECAVNFDRSEFVRRKFEFLALRQFGWIENPAPRHVTPARDANTNLASFGHSTKWQRQIAPPGRAKAIGKNR